MGWTPLSGFNFDAGENVVLFYKRRHPLVWAALLAVMLGVLLIAAAEALDPSPGIRYRGDAAWFGLFVLLPPLLRGIVLIVAMGWTFEKLYRQTRRAYDRNPDFVIGPTGIADLDPWGASALAWSDIREIQRDQMPATLVWRKWTVSLKFVARRRRGFGLPRGWTEWLPDVFCERMIELVPAALGVAEEDLLAIVRRFAPELPVRVVVRRV